MGFRFPLWVYWALAGSGVVAALVFTLTLDFSTVSSEQAGQLLFIVWGGPVTLVIAAVLVTLLARSTKKRR